MGCGNVADAVTKTGNAREERSLGRDKGAYFGPGTVGSDEEVEARDGSVIEMEGKVLVDAAETMVPFDHVFRQGVDENLAQMSAIDFWTTGSGAFFVALHVDIAAKVIVNDLQGLAIEAGMLKKLLVEASHFQSGKAGVGVQVESATLVTGVDTSFAFIDGDVDGRARL